MRTFITLLAALSLVLAPTINGCAADYAGETTSAGFLDSSEVSGRREAADQANQQLSASSASPAVPPPAGAQPATRPPGEPRQVIYSAAYRVVVADVAGTLRSIQSAAERLGGYMQDIAGGTITVRVPAPRFAEACKTVEEAGEVVDRQVKAQDVTEEMRDLHIRLDNAEKLRQRLLGILEKTQKVEDALKVEAELARVSAEIDQAKGKIRFLESQLAMSTIRVDLNPAVAQNARGTGPRLPFAWVEQLGDGLVAGQLQQKIRKAGFFSRGPSFTPPPGFVRYYESSDETEAMDAGGLLLRVQRHPNLDKAPLDFWAKLARRQMVEGRALAVAGEENDGKSYVLRGVRDVGDKKLGYLLSVRRSDRQVIVFEAWGPAEEIDKSVSVVRGAALSTNP